MITPKQEMVVCFCVDVAGLQMPPLLWPNSYMVSMVRECQCDCDIWTECAKARAVAGGLETARE